MDSYVSDQGSWNTMNGSNPSSSVNRSALLLSDQTSPKELSTSGGSGRPVKKGVMSKDARN